MKIPVIETNRLRLRAFVPHDLERLYGMLGDPDVMRYLPGGTPRSKPQTEATLETIRKHWQQHGFGWWAVEYKANEAMIGWCGLKFIDTTREVEVLYLLAQPYWGRGLATEAAKASLRYGFEELELDRIIALAHPDNIASRRVMEKMGMQYQKMACYYGLDVAYYAFTREAFRPDGALYLLRG
jgi:RimJ/RimL family protein N-acetyltransferase